MTDRRSGRARLFASLLLVALPTLAQAQPAVLRVSADDVVELALENNLHLKRERFGLQIADEEVGATTTAWTPELATRVGTTGSQAPSVTTFDASQPSIVDRQLLSEAAWSQRLPWGTSYSVAWTGGRHASNSALARFDTELQAGASATLVQPLLKGFRFDAARADHRTSLEAREIAGATLNTAIASTTLDVRRTFWLWVYTRDYLSVQRESLQMAQTLLDGNRTRVAAGAMAAVDVIEAQAEVARRSESIAIAEKAVANAEDLMRTLIFDPADPRWSAPLEPTVIEPEPMAPAGLVERALGTRQDLAALRASTTIEDIALKRARNDTLPDASLRAGYSVHGIGGADYRSVLDDLARTRYPAWSLELSVSYPIGQAKAEADAARASLRRQQAEAAVKAAEQRVAMEVRSAVREVDANHQRLELTATAVTLAERRLEAEQRKFTVGLSTSFFVFQAQRDLSQAREAALRATLDYRAATAEIAAVPVIPVAR